jgi:hypothetical protein
MDNYGNTRPGSLLHTLGTLIAYVSTDVSQILLSERPNLLAWTGKLNLAGLPATLARDLTITPREND